MAPRSRARGSTAALLACVCLLTGVSCGEDSAEPQGPTVQVTVTRDFGRIVEARDDVALRDHPTVLSALRANHEARVVEGGYLVSIDGRAQRLDDSASEAAWVLNVNGIEADELPSELRLHPGDVVQFDYRDWYETLDVRATVGAFPQPFTGGMLGRRFPVAVRCERPASKPCGTVKQALRSAGVAIGGPKPTGRPTLALVREAEIWVGAWSWVKRARNQLIDMTPRYSGVFARFTRDGSLSLFDWNAHRQREEGPGTGLVAATRPTDLDLLWFVTGVDQLGVRRAAAALDAADLRDAFAVAVTDEGPVKLPLPPHR